LDDDDDDDEDLVMNARTGHSRYVFVILDQALYYCKSDIGLSVFMVVVVVVVLMWYNNKTRALLRSMLLL